MTKKRTRRIGESKPIQPLLVLVILSLLGPTARCAGAGAADLQPRVAEWHRCAALLDEGSNEQALAESRSLIHEYPQRLELVDICLRARLRLAPVDTALRRVAADLAGTAVSHVVAEHFLTGVRLRYAERNLAAAVEFEQALAICLADGDTLSAAVAGLYAAGGRMRGDDLENATALNERTLTWLRDCPGTDRLAAEVQVLVTGCLYLADEQERAEAAYRDALDHAVRQGYRHVQADCLNGLGSLYSRRRQIRQSLDFHRDALQISQGLGDRERECIFLCNLVYDETNAREMESARRHGELAEQIATTWGYDYLLVSVYNGLGSIAETAGDRARAVAYFRQACASIQTTAYTVTGAGAYQRLAFNLMVQGEYRQALNNYRQSLDILENLESQYVLNWVLGGLALTNHKLGYLDRAEAFYRRALEVNTEFGDRMSAAWCLNSLGLIHSLRGEYRQALVFNNEALARYEELDDQEGVCDAHISIAVVYSDLGDYNRFQHHARNAFAIANELGYEEPLRKAVQLLATLYAATGRLDEAEAYYLQALEIARRWSDRVVEIWVLNDLAELCLQTGRDEQARAYLAEAVTRQESEGQYDLRSRSALLLGRSATSPRNAVSHTEGALELAEAGCLPEREWNCLSDLGQYHLALGDTVQARSYQLRAVELVESLRRNVGVDELRRHMLRPAIVPYERLIAAVLGGERDGEAAAAALTVSERSRAQVLAGRLRSSLDTTDPGPGATGAYAPQERDLLASITFLQSQLQSSALSDAERTETRDRVAELEREFSLLRLRISRQDSAYAATAYPEIEGPGELLATLRPQEHLLSYFLGTETSYLFSATATGVTVHRLPPRSVIERKVELYLRLQEQSRRTAARDGVSVGVGDEQSGEDRPGDNRPADSRPDDVLPAAIWATAQRELYDLLIGPAAAELRPDQTLIVVPDGLLHRLSFGFLRGSDGYLLEQHEVFYSPSLRTLTYLRGRTAARRLADTAEREIVALGCSGRFEPGGEPAARVHPFSGEPITMLPYADEEAQRVADLFRRSLVLIGNEADESSVRTSPLADTDILHVAAHSFADEQDVRRSFIVLNHTPEKVTDDANSRLHGGDDDLLQWHEIANLKLKTSLVTLASCRSASGVLAYGEGVTGLSQAFLYAGSSSILAAQTDVPDALTRRLMVDFYGQLRTGRSAAAALRAVQLAALDWPGCRPVDIAGAGFQLIGDGAVTIPQTTYPVPRALRYGIIIVVTTIVTTFLVRRNRRRRASVS